MNFLVKNRVSIQTFKGNTPYIVISITTPDNIHPNMPADDPNFVGALKLVFTDDDHDINKGNALKQVCKLITPKDADDILKFVSAHTVDTVVCQCDAGISRSSAVAAALSYIINGSDRQIFDNPQYAPNMLVYKTILMASCW